MSRGPRQGFTGRAAGLAAARPRPDFTRLAGAAAPCPGFKDLIGPGSGFTQARLRLAGTCRPRPAFAEAAVKAYGHRRHSLQAQARRRGCRGTRPADSPCGLASLVLSQACSSRPARAQRRAALAYPGLSRLLQWRLPGFACLTGSRAVARAGPQPGDLTH